MSQSTPQTSKIYTSLLQPLCTACVAFCSLIWLWSMTPAVTAGPLPPSLPNGVAAGDVSQTGAVLWTHSTALGVVTFTYGTDITATIATITRTVTGPLLPVTVTLSNLTPNTHYQYQVVNTVGANATGQFTTAASVEQSTGLRFGVSGDSRGELSPFVALNNAPGRQLNFFVEEGDTIYADYPSPAVPISQATTLDEFRLKHSEVYSTRLGVNLLAALRASTASFATPDDHEVLNNFAGGANAASDPRFHTASGLINDTALFENGMQAFQEYNPLRSEFYGMVGGDGRMDNERKFYRYRTFGKDAALLILDNRSFRDAPITALANLSDLTRFLSDAFQAGRTLLGSQQLQDVKANLLDAQQKGITWKFIAVPEPIQNLGPAAAEDRFEGYAAERNELLKFVTDNQISNVVFVAADIHGTIVNNLTYQTGVNQPQIQTGAFEVIVGPVAYDAPFGPTIVGIATQLGLLSEAQVTQYNALPIKNDADSTVDDKDDFIKSLLNQQFQLLGYDNVGLDSSPIAATLRQGDYVAVHTFGWTEFEIAKDTQVLTVTTYGVPAYTPADVLSNPAAITARTPAIVSQFRVNPVRSATTVFLPVIQR
ncbi:MAG: alkaline phosphatase D family protein [Caldilineaceae bacterium]